MSTAYLKVTVIAFSLVSFCKSCDFLVAFFACFARKGFGFLTHSAKGRKASLVQAQPHGARAAPLCPPSPMGWDEAGRGSEAARRRGSPYHHPNPSLLWGPLPAGAGEMRRAGESSWGNGFKLFGHAGSVPSPSLALRVSLEKLLRGGRHRDAERWRSWLQGQSL